MRIRAGIDDVGRIESPFAAVHETHIGVVFLVGDRAYKIRKPVRTGFLDFNTPELRLTACRREIELNRRLAPDVYLGLAEVNDPAGGGAESAVVMRRMPPSARLSTLVSEGGEVSVPLRALARLLAAFRSHAERGPHIDAEGSRDALLARWNDSFAQVQRFQAGVLDDAVQSDIERLTRRFLAGRTALFDDRVAEGRVLDGHGDLIADDVFCLPDGPRALDCLEFDDRLRYVDGLDDAAFLTMDLARDPADATRRGARRHPVAAAGAPPGLALGRPPTAGHPPTTGRRDHRVRMTKYVYAFAEGNKDLKDLLGGKGANLAEMTNMGLPVPPGFVITTEACSEYLESGAQPPELAGQVNEQVAALQAATGKRLGDTEDPLLVLVRPGRCSRCRE